MAVKVGVRLPVTDMVPSVVGACCAKATVAAMGPSVSKLNHAIVNAHPTCGSLAFEARSVLLTLIVPLFPGAP